MFGKAGVFFMCSSMGKPLNLELGLLNTPDAKEPEVVLGMGFGSRYREAVSIEIAGKTPYVKFRPVSFGNPDLRSSGLLSDNDSETGLPDAGSHRSGGRRPVSENDT